MLRRLSAPGPRFVWRGIALIASLTALGVLIRASGLNSVLDESWIDLQVRGHGLEGQLLFFAVGVLATAAGFPRQVIAFLGGYAFGIGIGTALALAAAVVGCAAAFAYARLLGRDLVMSRFPKRIRKVDAFLRDHPLSMTLMIRMLPVGSNLATNLAAGVSSVPAAAFVAGSAIGYLPQTLVFALVGSGVNVDPVVRVGLAIALFVASSLLAVQLYRRARRSSSFDAELDRELEPIGTGEAEAAARRGDG